MHRTRIAGLALVATSLAGLATLAPTSQAAVDTSTFTWQNKVVGDNSSYTEPSLSIDKKGNIVTCVPGGPGTVMWISEDDGATFRRSETGVAEGTGGGDCEIHFLPDGRLVNSDLAISTSYIHTSDDLGQTWTRQDDAGIEQDRQWFASYNAGEPVLHHIYHSISHEYEFYVTSTDSGATWSAPKLINSPDQVTCTPNAAGAKPGDSACLGDQGYNTYSGPMLIDQNTGEFYVVYGVSDAQNNATSVAGFGAPRGLVVAHSTDGTNWTNKYAVIHSGLKIGEEYVASGFPWGVIDKAGNVYVVFNSNEGGHYHTYYAYSTDHAETWSEPIKLDDNPIDQGATIFSTGAAGDDGLVDFAWIETDTAVNPDDPAAEWHINFAQVRGAASATPDISHSRITTAPMHRGNICLHGTLCAAPNQLGGGSRSLGDFFELAVGPDGLAQVAFTNDGTEGEPKNVTWAKQRSGPSVYAAAAPPVTPPAPGPSTPPVVNKPVPTPAAPGSMPATGLPSALPIAALVILGAAGVGLAVRRRRSE